VFCREVDFQDEIVERIFELAKMSIRLQKVKIRRAQWKMLVGLSIVSKQGHRVIGREGSKELCVQFENLPLKAKKHLFESVVDSVCLKGGEYRYDGQNLICMKIVACKIVNKRWKYWIDKACKGKEMRMGYICCDWNIE
jgi:hypothetical protein